MTGIAQHSFLCSHEQSLLQFCNEGRFANTRRSDNQRHRAKSREILSFPRRADRSQNGITRLLKPGVLN